MRRGIQDLAELGAKTQELPCRFCGNAPLGEHGAKGSAIDEAFRRKQGQALQRAGISLLARQYPDRPGRQGGGRGRRDKRPPPEWQRRGRDRCRGRRRHVARQGQSANIDCGCPSARSAQHVPGSTPGVGWRGVVGAALARADWESTCLQDLQGRPAPFSLMTARRCRRRRASAACGPEHMPPQPPPSCQGY